MGECIVDTLKHANRLESVEFFNNTHSNSFILQIYRSTGKKRQLSFIAYLTMIIV